MKGADRPAGAQDLASAPEGPPGSPGGTSEIPPVEPPKVTAWWRFSGPEADERDQIEKDGSQSHNIRRIAAYGGLVVVLLLYCCGIAAIVLFLGLMPGHADKAAKPETWHLVALVLAALFTVPTVVLLAVLRATTRRDEGLPASVHEALGQVVMKLVDKVVDGKS